MALLYGFHFGEATDARTFADVFRTLVGDGIFEYGSKFQITINGFEATIGTGRAMAGGWWLWNDAPHIISIQAPSSSVDRIDAIAIRVRYAERKIILGVLTGIDYESIAQNPAQLCTESEYVMLLYTIRVRRSASTLNPEDITDLRANGNFCGYITPLSKISVGAIHAFNYFTTDMGEEINQIYAYGDQLVQQGDNKIAALKAILVANGSSPDIGEILISYTQPVPQAQWLRCSGGAIPTGYRRLYELMNGSLPSIENGYIYGGVQESDFLVTEDSSPILIGNTRIIV